MTGVFVASAAVGAILGGGGFAAYLKTKFDEKKDAELIENVIKEKDNPFIIIKLIEVRFPNQRDEIQTEYEKFNEDKKFIPEVLNFIPYNKKEHFLNLMTPTEEIVAKTDEVKAILDYKSFDKYFENEFDEVKDVVLINEVMKRSDDPLIIVRLLSYRDE